MKRNNGIIVVTFLFIASASYNVYLYIENLELRKNEEQLLREVMETENRVFHLVMENDMELAKEEIAANYRMNSRIMKRKYRRELGITNELDSLPSHRISEKLTRRLAA